MCVSKTLAYADAGLVFITMSNFYDVLNVLNVWRRDTGRWNPDCSTGCAIQFILF